MSNKKSSGQMPFLDHLEELRWRILWSLAALVVGSVAGFFIVQNFDVFGLLKQPIAPYLADGRLFVTHPLDPFLITIKLAVLVGAILAFPVILWQAWTFLSPALYEEEKRKIIPAVMAGFGLFAAGAMMAYLWVLPAVLRISFSFLEEGLEQIITAGEYLSFATQVILAFGIVFQLPLFMIVVSAMGLLGPEFFSRNRRYAFVLATAVAAFLTPPDPGSMVMMVVPLVLLYELGLFLSKLVAKRAKPPNTIATGIFVLLMLGTVQDLSAQEGRRLLLPDSVRRGRETVQPSDVRALDDSTLARPASDRLDSAVARQLGLPTSPSRRFPAADSVIRQLLERSGFRATRYAADSLTLHGESQQIDLAGNALVEREGSTLEADNITFLQADCRLIARGEPTLFGGGSVLVGKTMTYDTCENRGLVGEALTNFNQGGVDWFLRGGIAVDSGSTRLYSAESNLSSCELPIPHYHFSAGKVKWVSNNVMVARPVVLYVRDIPILWLPFTFQDVRQGRRSGWLVPRFGINDLVRPTSGYRRNLSNIGYYLALSNYFDVQASFDWFAGNYIAVNGQLRYKWLDQFVDGGVSLSRIFESGEDGRPGGRSLRLTWNHRQSFNLRTRLTASVDYATSARVVERNTVDPFLATATLTSAVNFNKRYEWGTLVIGGRRTQNITDKLVREIFPSVSLTPVPLNIGRDVTWSPAFSFTNDRTFNQFVGTVELPPSGGEIQLDSIFASTRQSNVRLNTPLRIGRWNLQNSITITDFITNRPSVLTVTDPQDSSQSVTRFFGSDFSTGIDWNTGINLPLLFPSSWRVQPSLGIRNSTSGPFLLRNRNTGGRWVSQGKRLSLGVTASPTVFGFFPGVGPLSRIRHAVSPTMRWSYAPRSTVPEDYARALDPTGSRLQLTSNPLQTVSLRLSQTFEGKFALSPEDSAGQRNARKVKLLAIRTSPVEYDFEQAKQQGRNGWRTQILTNAFTSDLLPGFSLRTVHDLWDGPVGFDTTSFDPFLRQVSARFRLTAGTVARIVSLFTGRSTPEAVPIEEEQPVAEEERSLFGRPRSSGIAGLPTERARGRGFSAAITFDDLRTRQPADAPEGFVAPGTNRTLGFAVGFSPSQHWSASWNTQYNFTRKEFGQHIIRLDRDLHRWKATFSFVRTPNGNVGFNFFVTLLDQPDIKFQYDQRTIAR